MIEYIPMRLVICVFIILGSISSHIYFAGLCFIVVMFLDAIILGIFKLFGVTITKEDVPW